MKMARSLFFELKLDALRYETAVSDLHIHFGTVVCAGRCLFDGLYNFHSLQDSSEHHVFPIEPWCRHGGNKELGPICVFSCIGHGKETGFRMAKLEVFVTKLVAVNRFPASSIASCEVAALNHEVLDNPMEL